MTDEPVRTEDAPRLADHLTEGRRAADPPKPPALADLRAVGRRYRVIPIHDEEPNQ